MEAHLQKIKLLLELSKNNPNENEAANAALLAKKLIEKFKVSEAQLQEIENSDKPIYSEENLLIEVEKLEDWINILALVCSKKYDAWAIQEENIAQIDNYTKRTYKYFVYGDPDDVLMAQYLFNYIYPILKKTIEDHCEGEDVLFKESFSEGLINGVRTNIEYEQMSMEGMVKKSPEPEDPKPDAVAKVEKAPFQAPPIERRTNVRSKEKDIDPYAYFEGQSVGRDIHIGKMDAEKKLQMRLTKMFDIIAQEPEDDGDDDEFF